MSSVENVMTNDDLDELTAMLQSLDEPVKKAAQVENTDDIDDLLLGIDAGVAMSSDDVAEELFNEEKAGDFSSALNELELAHEPINVINAESGEAAENEPEQLGIIEVEDCVEVNDELKVQQSNDSNTNKKTRAARGPSFTLSDKDDSFFNKAGLEKDIFLDAYENAPVKAKDKILNLLNWFSGGPDISVYTVISMRHLLTEKKATSIRRQLVLPTGANYTGRPFSATSSHACYRLRCLFPVAFPFQFEHISVMDQSVCCRHRHSLIHEDAAPHAERMVTGYHQAPTFIAMRY